MVEWLIVVLLVVAVDLAAVFGGSDSRPGIDDAPYRAL